MGLTILAFVGVLSLLVFVHELGHFIVAKRAGILVDEFAFGYPPRVLKYWQSEGKIVLDGKAKIIGRKTYVSRQIEAGRKVAYQSHTQPDGREIITQFELIPSDMPDEEVKAKFKEPIGIVDQVERGTEYTINLIPFGGFVRMLGQEDPSLPGSFASKSKRIRTAVLVAGAGMNIILAIFVFSATFMLGAPRVIAADNVMIMSVVTGSPADKAGLRLGDMVLAIDGIAIKSPDELVKMTGERLDKEVRLTIKRGQDTTEVLLTPRSNHPQGEGPMGVSIQPAASKIEIAYYSFGESLWMGLQQTFSTIALTFSVPLLILRGLIPAEAVRPIGPYGIYQQTASAIQATVQMGWWYPILSLVGLISTALAITNLLPLPALDGGRIMFIVVEAIRGRRIDPAREGFVHFVGLAVLVGLMLVISYFDIIRPVTTIDWTSMF